MKNSFKRFLGMVLAVGVAGSTLCAPAQVFTSDSAMFFSDDFQAYDVSSSLMTGPGTSVTNDVWKMSSIYCGWDNRGGSAVCAEGENKYLQLLLNNLTSI